jgi:hypothetical protein
MRAPGIEPAYPRPVRVELGERPGKIRPA